MVLYADIEQILSELENNSLGVNSMHWVHVTHIINPHNFYVRNTNFLPFIEKLESTKPLVQSSLINIQDLVIVNISDLDEVEKYARGKIIQIKKVPGSIMCDVFLLDYGNVKSLVPKKNIWVCSPELRDMPPLTLFCQLGNCSPIGDNTEWTRKSTDAFKFYIGTERARMKILDNSLSKLIVELYNTAPDDIATLMALTGYSTLGYVKNDCHN